MSSGDLEILVSYDPVRGARGQITPSQQIVPETRSAAVVDLHEPAPSVPGVAVSSIACHVPVGIIEKTRGAPGGQFVVRVVCGSCF
jgi:hypothetical protein